MKVDVNTPGTGSVGGCLNCNRPIGEDHLETCEFATGEDNYKNHGGILGMTARDNIWEFLMRGGKPE